MNDKPIKLEMNRDELAQAIEDYWNRLLVGDYNIESMTLHTGAKGSAAATVKLTPVASDE